MGVLRLLVNDWGRLPDEQLARVFVAGPDELPCPGQTFRSDDQLIVERREETSGCLWAPWPMDGPAGATPDDGAGELGEWLIGTASLMERDRPYLLEVELARGTVYRLRNQLATWRQLGLESTDALDRVVAEATRLFCRAATCQDDHAAAAGSADRAVRAAAEGSVLLTSIYAEQAMEVRRPTGEQLPTLLGVGLNSGAPAPTDDLLPRSFSSVALRCAWNAVEADEGKRRWKAIDAQFNWAQQAGVRVCAGPLIDFCDQSIPDWAYLWEGDFEALSTLLLTHVKTVVGRYRGRVQLWNVAGRVNRAKSLKLSDEQRLQLVARAVRAVREADPKTPAVVSFDQPWGEYLTSEPSDLAPIDFADALERADLGIAGFGLEMNLGYTPDGASLRNPLDISRLLDYWSLRLELPLMLQVSLPSGAGADPLAGYKGSIAAGGVGGATLDPAFQHRWVESCVPMLLAKNCVQVVLWNTLADNHPHRYPHGGLLDASGAPKPALGALRAMREAYLV